MKKENRDLLIFTIIGIIIILAIVLPIAINQKKENEKLNKSFETIGNSASDYIKETENVKSHLDDFSYNYETGEVEYQPLSITLEMYNRIEEGMSKNDVTSILGKEDNVLEKEGNTYVIEYGNSYLTKGYWIQIIIEKNTEKVVSKYQVGLN